MTPREWIKTARENDLDVLIDGLKRIYNCREADVDAEGDIWIEGPQRGHWLSEADLDRIAFRIEAGNL